MAINLFAWTYLKNEVLEDGSEVEAACPHRPFVTWPCQDNLLVNVIRCVRTRRPVGVWKTREMGASWVVLAAFWWFFLFDENKEFLLMSRTEELVDAKGDMDALFPKVRYMLAQERIPEWVLEPELQEDTFKHLRNNRNNCTIDGRATTGHAGAGGRRDAILLDEFSRVQGAETLWRTLSDTAKCRVAVSTPYGGSYFNRLRFSGLMEWFSLMWWEHPMKAQGLGYVRDPESGRWRFTSPWYRFQEKNRDKKDMAENVDADPKGSTEGFFGDGMLARYHIEVCNEAPPVRVGRLVYDTEIDPSQVDSNIRDRIWQTTEFSEGLGPWRFWCQLFEDPEWGLLRPRQDKVFVGFADISKGTGASNTVFAFYDVESAELAAEYADPNISPDEAARLFCAAAAWFGGSYEPLLGWENNGDGVVFGRQMMKCEWPRIYWQEQIGTRSEERTKMYGWNSGRKTKIVLLAEWRAALERREVKCWSAEAIDEAGRYIRYETDEIGPAELADMQSGARAAHGDRVIAHSGARLMIVKNGLFEAKKHAKHAERSFAARHKARERQRKEERKASEW